MRCPRCGHLDDKVVDSRQTGDGDIIRRRRECLGCSARFTTYERVERSLPSVQKHDGRREPYQREKLLSGIQRACEKRPISMQTIEDLANRVEARMLETTSSEVESRWIGDLVMEELKQLDGVAYLRFASVYQSFQDISEFLAEAARVADEGA